VCVKKDASCDACGMRARSEQVELLEMEKRAAGGILGGT
jgi:hypothetical protein